VTVTAAAASGSSEVQLRGQGRLGHSQAQVSAGLFGGAQGPAGAEGSDGHESR
jgi:hypothetical protein